MLACLSTSMTYSVTYSIIYSPFTCSVVYSNAYLSFCASLLFMKALSELSSDESVDAHTGNDNALLLYDL